MASAPAFSWRYAGLVAGGGAVGTAIRLAITIAPWGDATVYVVPVINVVGAFLLGVITSLAVRRGDTERSRRIRHFFGGGVMGGFTTYSAFAVAAVGPQTIWLTLATAVVGTLAGWAGLMLARTRRSA
ncbi:CrcB family protein [Microbacterium sp. X-17]|uniref:CrcB family protein n=1 Tax=Microbacterium sp. X-17 TaxID=3144404 RepID=UPI0031F59EA1